MQTVERGTEPHPIVNGLLWMEWNVASAKIIINGRDLNTGTRERLFPDGKVRQVAFEIAPPRCDSYKHCMFMIHVEFVYVYFRSIWFVVDIDMAIQCTDLFSIYTNQNCIHLKLQFATHSENPHN